MHTIRKLSHIFHSLQLRDLAGWHIPAIDGGARAVLHQRLAVPRTSDARQCCVLLRAVWIACVDRTPSGNACIRVRVVTLLPSATEIVCALGLDERLVGVSHSCSYPPKVLDLPVMTSTHVPYTKSSEVIDAYVRDHLTGHEALYDLDIQRLSDARPDVVVSQALCDVCAVSTGDVLEAIHSLPTAPTLIDLEPNTLADVFDDIVRVGKRLEAGDAAAKLVADLGARRDVVAARTASVPLSSRPRVAFLEWLYPPFNGGHWNP